MFQSGGPSTLPERKGPQEMATPSSSCVSERMDEREAHVVHIKEEPNDWEDLVTQMVTSTDASIVSLSRLQRLSSHAGAWTSEPQPPPPLPAPWASEPLPPAPWASEPFPPAPWGSEPPPLPPAPLAREPPLPPTPWIRKEQILLSRSVIPTQGTEHAVGALESINTTAQLRVKPFSCPHCGKSFPQLRNLKDHQKYHHTGKKAFTCSQCGMGFVYVCHLRVHMQRHTRERAFTCSQCGKGFVYMCHLRVHMQCHTGERPFSCSQCGKSFSLQSGLKRRRVLYTAEMPYHW